MMVQSKIGRFEFNEIVDPATWYRVYDWRATWMMRRDREVVDFTRSRVKNNTELTNLGN